MDTFFLKFQASNYWYLIIITFVIAITILLIHVKKKSEYKYEKILRLIILAFWFPIILCSLALLTMFMVAGFLQDRVANYTGILLIIGPIIIFFLIIYALINEKKKK